jgi:hypothetical protein
LEYRFSQEVETIFLPSIEIMTSSNDHAKIENAEKSIRKYLLLSYLRTPGVKKYYKEDE